MGLLTKQEYEAIAAGLDLPNAAFIDGAFRPAASGKTFTSTEHELRSVLRQPLSLTEAAQH